MNRRRIGVFLIVGGIALAAIVGFLVYQQADAAEQLRQAQPKNWAVVALIDIPERSIIAADQLDVIRVPDLALPPGNAVYRPPVGASDTAIEAGKANAKGAVVGQLTGQRIYKGEVINTDRLGKPATQSQPSLLVPKGKVWYHLPVNTGAGGQGQSLLTALNFVRPGDFIDVYYTTTETPAIAADPTNPTEDALKGLYTRRILQAVKVINVGLFPPGTPGGPPDLTLELTPRQALQMKWLKDASAQTGNMEFVVRSPLDNPPEDQIAAAPTEDLNAPLPTIDYPTVSGATGIGTGR